MSSPPRNSRFSKKAPFKASGARKPPKGGKTAPYTAKSRPRHTSKPRQISQDWVWGSHAALAALKNSARTVHEVLITEPAARRLTLPKGISVKTVSPQELDRKFGDNAVHQGIAVRASLPPDSTIEALAEPCEGLIVVLDQITDPHNVGAMLRLAAAFGARGIIMQDRKAPPMAGATAKVAVGCIETVPYALVSNIANTLLDLQDRGWMVTGLAGEGEMTISQATVLPKNAAKKANVIVMGAEGPGLRPRVRSCCHQLARIPMPGGAESLNVATAAAIALYEAVRD